MHGGASSSPKNIVLAITGASGSIYGRRLLEVTLAGGHSCQLIISSAGRSVIHHELAEDPSSWASSMVGGERLTSWEENNLFAPFCSGSSPPDAMVIAPCSMGTLGRIASCQADSLLTRSADVCLKERIPLVLAVRETPLNLIHIENMSLLTRAGGIILPASPGFYHRPDTIAGLVDHIVGKILDTLLIKHTLFKRWGDE